jgi:AraC-like DNA-binding protein
MSYRKEYLYKKIVRAKQVIDKNYSGEINLNVLINEAHISKYHFIRLFKSIYKITPHQYIISKRVKSAKSKLENSDDSITSICFSVGFNSVGSFCNLFKKTTLQTPLEYRATVKELNGNRNSFPLKNIPGCYTILHHPSE